MPAIEIKAKGADWSLVPNLVRKLEFRRFQRRVDRGLAVAAQMVAGEIRKGIESGAPGGQAFVPLSEVTVRRKGHSRPLIESEALMRSIEPKRLRMWEYRIGPREGARHPRGSEDYPTIADIGALHESGTKDMPARPFIAPVIDSIRDEVVELVQRDVDIALDPRRR